MPKKIGQDKGEVMLEGMIIIVLTMLLLVWILGVGFLYYQRFLVTSVTNDAAAKVAATFNNPESDLVMGYIEEEDLTSRDLYRGFRESQMLDVNQAKAEAYIKYMLKKTNFAGTIDEDSVTVEVKLVPDSALRRHVRVHTVCTFNTPFGSGLEIFGMKSRATYEATARADCTDIIDYLNTSDFAEFQLSGGGISSKVVKMINSIMDIFNHIYVKR